MQPYDYIEIRVPAKAQYVGVARLDDIPGSQAGWGSPMMKLKT